MEPDHCPPWIEPGNAFRLVLKVAKYTAAVVDDGLVEMLDQGSWRCSLTGTKKRKRTNKTSVKPGRKKSNTGDIPAPEQATPRTRLALAREAAVRARLQAEEAQLKASQAMEAAEAAARAANRDLLAEPVPIEIQLAAPATPSGPSTRRKLLLSAAEPIPEGELQVMEVVPKKMTPRRKMLASKTKKK